jgi:hypothetical protein
LELDKAASNVDAGCSHSARWITAADLSTVIDAVSAHKHEQAVSPFWTCAE